MATVKTAKWSEWIKLAARLDAGEPIGPGATLRNDAFDLLRQPAEVSGPDARCGADARIKVLAACKRASAPSSPPSATDLAVSAAWVELARRFDAGDPVADEARALLRCPGGLTPNGSKASIKVLAAVRRDSIKRKRSHGV